MQVYQQSFCCGRECGRGKRRECGKVQDRPNGLALMHAHREMEFDLEKL